MFRRAQYNSEQMLWCRCIVAKCYSAALPVLDQEFDDVDPKKTGMTARDFLLFCYYGGMIYTGGLMSTSFISTT